MKVDCKTILIADDDPVVVDLLKKPLEERGYHIVVASSGADAIRSAKRDEPDLILLDVVMPGLDGVDVAGYLQDEVQTSHIPVLYVTGLQASEQEGSIREIMKDNVVTKPIDIPELLERIEFILRD